VKRNKYRRKIDITRKNKVRDGGEKMPGNTQMNIHKDTKV